MTASFNIASHLPAMAAKQPHRLAVVFPKGRDRQGRVSYTHYTFRQLDEASDRLARGLIKAGVGRGVRTVLMVKPSLDFFALTFALFKAGAVPVLVDPGMGVRNLGECLAEAEPEAFIGIPKAQIARILLRWARRSLRTIITVGPRLFWGGYTLSQIAALGGDATSPVAETHADDVAAILFTSGSTGVPKGAVYTHGIFAAQVELLRETYGIEPGEIDLPTFPLFALFAPALGMTAIVPDMDFTRPGQVDPRKIIEAIENFGVTTMFGSPALLRRVADHGVREEARLPSLRRVISAGAPVPAEVLERFTTMLAPGVQVFTPYGATEALPVASIGSTEILQETRARTVAGEGVCVGRPVPPMEVRVIKISDEPIAQWSEELRAPSSAIGEIVVKGPVVTREYYRRPESTALAKIIDTDGGILHRMGDLGYVDGQGRLWFCGRKSHRVVTAKGTLFTIPCEGVFNAHPKVLRTALVGVGKNGEAKPVLCVELRQPAQASEGAGLQRELRELGATRPHTRDINTFLFHPSFPVDIRHNAKIFREKLAVWAAQQLKSSEAPRP
jgi:acyl-CoA synthetase (AMP-forming)/AMP-acid ligase II